MSAPHTTIRSGTSDVYTINHYPKTTFHATITLDLYKLDILNRVFCHPVSMLLTNDVTRHAAPSLEGFQHFRNYCSNFRVKNLLIIADILVIRGKSLTRTLSLRRTPTTVADHGYTADSGSILIARCGQLIAGLARSIECNRTVWHNETR